jgi:multiple sugar transport system substrate-binding protein
VRRSASSWAPCAPAVRELQRALAGGAGGQLDDLGRDVGVVAESAGDPVAFGTKAEANSDANVEALTYVQQHLQDGTFAYASDVGAGSAGLRHEGAQAGVLAAEDEALRGAGGELGRDIRELVS